MLILKIIEFSILNILDFLLLFYSKKNIDGKLTLLNDMVHGFLCFDAPSGLKYAATCVKICGDLISKLLKQE